MERHSWWPYSHHALVISVYLRVFREQGWRLTRILRDPEARTSSGLRLDFVRVRP